MSFLITLLLILTIYPYFIAKFIDEYTLYKRLNNKQVIKNILIICLITTVSLIIITASLITYEKLLNGSFSKLCTNIGDKTLFIYLATLLIVTALTIIIHHFLSQKFICKIFECCNKTFRYIFMYIHMIFIYFLNWLLFLSLLNLEMHLSKECGVYVNNTLNLLIYISPTGLFVISTIIYAFKNKKK